MRRKIILGIMILSGIITDIYARNTWRLLYGVNGSSLVNAKSQSKMGFTFGIGNEWSISRNFGITMDILYARKNLFLERITLVPVTWEQFSGMTINTINAKISIAYFDVPLSIKYNIINKQKIKYYISAGTMFSIACRDLCRKETISSQHIDGPFYPPPYYSADYYFDPNLERTFFWGNSGCAFNVGLGIRWRMFFSEIRYCESLHTTGNLSWILVKKRIKTINLLIGIYL
jgi:hypothetical protein